MYKDSDKRRDKDRDRQRRYRASKGVTIQNVTKGVTNEAVAAPSVDEPRTVDTKQPRTLTPDKAKGITQGIPEAEVMVDIDNDGNITPILSQLQPRTPKRGKDIKCFADLPPDVQQTISYMSQRAGKIDPIDKANRTAIAINYHRLFPGRFHSVGVI